MTCFKLNPKVIVSSYSAQQDRFNRSHSILEAFYVQGSARTVYCTCFYLMDHGGKIMDSVMRNSNRFL